MTEHPIDASLLPTLLYVQAHLDGDLSLATLAARAGLSTSRFHRVFSTAVGETPKQYSQRLRLERAALRLCLHETTVLDTALEVGFHSHETFTRAFRRHFDLTPKEILQGGFEALAGRAIAADARRTLESQPDDYELSGSSLVRLKPMHVAFIRHVGPYESVGDDLWIELAAWATESGLEGPRVLLGIGHDAPGVTPANKLRFDAALRVETPFQPAGRVGHQTLPGGRYSVATHVGHYGTLESAYARHFEATAALDGVHPAAEPVIERYGETTLDVDARLNHTEIYLPVVDEG